MQTIALSVNLAAEESHNPLLPSTPDLLWGTVCFVIVLLFFWKYALPRVQKMLDERSEKIAGGIQKAEAAQSEAAHTLEAYNAQLADARGEAARIRAQARTDAERVAADVQEKARQEAARIVAQAQAQTEADRAAAFRDLKTEIGVLALDLASQVVGVSLGDDHRSKAVVDRFIDELGRTDAHVAGGAEAEGSTR